MNNNRQQQNQPTDDSDREQIISEIKGGIPKQQAYFLSLSAADREEFLRQARAKIAGFKSIDVRAFCNKLANAMEALHAAETMTERTLDLSQMPTVYLKTDDRHNK